MDERGMALPDEAKKSLELASLELVQRLYNVTCFDCSDVFCTHWQSSAASFIFDALTDAEQRGAEQRDKTLQQLIRAASDAEVNLHVAAGLLKAISIIRSNQ